MAKKTSASQRDKVVAEKLADKVELSAIDLDKAPLATEEKIRPQRIYGGVDNREPVEDTTAKPYRYICRIAGRKKKDGRTFLKVGTAFVIGRRTLVTAAHNLWLDEDQQNSTASANRIETFTIWPGQMGSTKPYGPYKATAFPFEGYESIMAPANDAAVMKLDRDLPVSFGALHWAPVALDELNLKRALISGYPACKPPRQTCSPTRPPHDKQYFHAGDVKAEELLLHYEIDTTKGQSGSPIIMVTDDNGTERSTAVGIHVIAGVESGEVFNRGVAFRPAIARFILDKLQEFEGTA